MNDRIDLRVNLVNLTIIDDVVNFVDLIDLVDLRVNLVNLTILDGVFKFVDLLVRPLQSNQPR